MTLKSITGNNDTFYKIVSSQIDAMPGADIILDEIDDMSSSKDKKNWLKNHPMIGVANNFEGEININQTDVSNRIGSMLRQSVPNRTQFTNALINKLILNKDFIALFTVSMPFKEIILNSLNVYNKSIMPLTTTSQTQQE